MIKKSGRHRTRNTQITMFPECFLNSCLPNYEIRPQISSQLYFVLATFGSRKNNTSI